MSGRRVQVRSLQVAQQHCFTLLSLLRPSHRCHPTSPNPQRLSIKNTQPKSVLVLWFVVHESTIQTNIYINTMILNFLFRKCVYHCCSENCLGALPWQYIVGKQVSLCRVHISNPGAWRLKLLDNQPVDTCHTTILAVNKIWILL